MAWSWIAPPRSSNMEDQNGPFRNYSDIHTGKSNNIKTYIFTQDNPAYIDVPSLLKFNLLIEWYPSASFADSSYKNKNTLKFVSDNHAIIFRKKSKTTFDVTMDEDVVIPEMEISAKDRSRIYVVIESGENGKIEFWNDSVKKGEYKGITLNNEPIKAFYVYDSKDNGADDYYFLVASEEPIPQSATVKVITPEVETDWEQGENGTYQTGEAGKTIKLKTPANAASAGKAVICSAPFLYSATAGDNVNGITAHSSYYDEDMPILNTVRSVGFRSGDDTVFTTRG